MLGQITGTVAAVPVVGISLAIGGIVIMNIRPATVTVLLGFGVSCSVGLLFGIWPAVKAARLDPIEALRYE